MRRTTSTRVAASLLIAALCIGSGKRPSVPERVASAATAAASCQEPPPPPPRSHHRQPEGCLDPEAVASR
jgi:hypothetical protein